MILTYLKNIPFGYSQNIDYSKTFIFLLVFVSLFLEWYHAEKGFLKCLENHFLS